MQKEIKLSQNKIAFTIIGSLCFVIAGVYLIVSPEKLQSTKFENLYFIQIAGGLSILFFGFIFVTIIKKVIIDRNVGLTINEMGIIDNSNYTGLGLIKWEDIRSIGNSGVRSTQLLLINLKDPEVYIDKEPSKLKRKMLRMNYKFLGTPITISSNFINCEFYELEAWIRHAFAEYIGEIEA